MDYALDGFRHGPLFGLHYIGMASYIRPEAWPPHSTSQRTLSIAFP
jgi:hypothetical protein